MKIQLSVEHMELTEKQKDYMEGKLQGLKKYSDILKFKEESVLIKVVLEKRTVHSGGQTYVTKVTMSVPHAVIRAEVGGGTVEEVTDLVIDKLKRQIERYKEKHLQSLHNAMSPQDIVEEINDTEVDDLPEPKYKVTRRKLFTDLFPMSEQEAISTMEALGHGFFIFVNEKTDRYNLVYNRRNSEGYGVVELEHSHGVING